MAVSFYFVEVMVLILLAVVGTLVIWLHFRLSDFGQARKKMPMLAETLSSSMTQAYEGITKLDEAIKTHSPELDKKLTEASKTLNELDYVLDRAEKLLTRLDNTFVKLGNDANSNNITNNNNLASKTLSSDSSNESVYANSFVSNKGQKPSNVTPLNSNVQQKSRQMATELGESLADIPLAGGGVGKSEKNILFGNNIAIRENRELTLEQEQPLRKTSSKRGSEIYGAVAKEIEISEAEEELHRALAGRI